MRTKKCNVVLLPTNCFEEGVLVIKGQKFFLAFVHNERIEAVSCDTHGWIPKIPQSFIRLYLNTMCTTKSVLIELEDNQCDGCKLNLPVVAGLHSYSAKYMDKAVCTANEYNNPKLINNEVIICKEKTSWNKEEILHILDTYRVEVLVENDYTYSSLVEWFSKL